MNPNIEDIDADWEKFLNNELDGQATGEHQSFYEGSKETDSDEDNIPKCTDIYVSTKTKISYLNKTEIDIKNIFWKIPILSYASPQEGVIKKQIKFSSTSAEQLAIIKEYMKNEKYVEEQVIEHIDNPEGRIKFKDQRKVSVGICKKNILNYRCKEKRAFFNCFVLILRIKDGSKFKEMHVKIFNTGKMEIPGIQSDDNLEKVISLISKTLKPYLGDDMECHLKNDTVLINSNFNCGYFIDRDKLYNLLKYKYNINSNFDSCSYPGIQCKFYYIPGLDNQTGQQPNENLKQAMGISFMIFRTGSVLIVGKCDEDVLYEIYDFLKNLLLTEYKQVGISLVNTDDTVRKSKKTKNS